MCDSMPEPGTAAGTVPGGEAEDPSGEGTAPAAGALLGPVAPAPLGVARTPTGDAGVDAELERLADADHLPADGHIEVYEDVHRGLRDTLTALDARPAPAPVPAPMPSYDNRS
ncbi:hypothetical protein OG978_09785 [Streptomyces sp. NBC_01591]|uniref:hypothetical protein n=1 Tax=Streptomyces sp. NBC_01591 TaxID=2975888 RepID=UPI002DDA1F41|nr:hypothetical protein [Streptomyces sp. NBC_01591]WSD67648.1 hypothetical protein OG978_09785 [Streptomyces sp. NBC_01591]